MQHAHACVHKGLIVYLLLAGTWESNDSKRLLRALSSLPLSDCAEAHASLIFLTAPWNSSKLLQSLHAMLAGLCDIVTG